MTIENSIRLLAGTLILLSLGMNYLYPDGYWIWLTVFVGFNLFQSSLTKFCPAEIIFKKLFFSKK
ncbi:MAG: DUF2892 domain-containing protein [Calditrichaeota bacterium]|nr:MAG: DUF2892 domain-containing protein [Calditrichota bacterium]